ncbi:hatching enzyme 1.2-like [Cloeon dipterum]|uniref:hatching enzyme 1.2-like n=1 Tax=Cloeon dipterum TaxID=197152 RepID=UPI00322042CC
MKMKLASILCFTLVMSPAWCLSEFNDEEYSANVNKIRRLSLGKPDAEVGQRLTSWNPESSVNPEELGSYFEGDMLMPLSAQGRNGIINTFYRWPNAEVFYKIIGTFNANQTALIYKAFDAFHANTCVRFKPYNGSQSNYLIIKSDNSGCWATLGKAGGIQYVNLQIPGCVTLIGTPIHELMHTLGFFHEHTRPDRDHWIKILWENVDRGSGFGIQDSNAFGVSYDYNSVMHVTDTYSSSKGLKTIETLQPPGVQIGQRNGLSAKDIQKINAMYNCAS